MLRCLVYHQDKIKLPEVERFVVAITAARVEVELNHMHFCHASRQMDVIWVIVDRLVQSTYFIPIHTTCHESTFARLYKDQIVRLHGIPQVIDCQIYLFLAYIFP